MRLNRLKGKFEEDEKAKKKTHLNKKEKFEYDYLNFPPLAAGKHTVTPDSLLAIT